MLNPNSCFLFLILLVIITCMPFSYPFSQSESEIQVLLKLKQQWSTSPFVQSWDPSTPHCTWPGIQCTNNSITGISLPHQNITTMIPLVICDLPNLSLLNLSYNFMHGGFPIVLYNCSRLQTLDLLSNNFEDLLPNDIYKLSNLQYLDIGSNNFKGDIPGTIGQLTKLTYLDFCNNSFDGTFPSEIRNLVNLEALSMGHNPFVPAMIPKEFGRLKKLNYLFMWGCNLIGYIPHSFANFSSLKWLELSSNNLVGGIPSGLFLLKNLTTLSLYENQLSGEIPTSIETLDMVKISLSQNKLTGPIPKDLGKLHKLEILYLYDNELSGTIPHSFANLSSLQELGLSNNSLAGVIPSGLFQLKSLTLLSLYENQLYGEIPTTIEAPNLVCIELWENNLIGEIPENIGKLLKLEWLMLGNNKLTGPIPESLTKCNILRVLNLGYNAFIGEVPIRIWKMPNITNLNLQYNELSGKLPSQLSTTLLSLNIRNNKFSGPISLDVGSWKNLVIFHASNNQLQGVIPFELTSLSNLNDLQLDGNCFFGDLPSRIISWKSLANLNLSQNEISGQIPKALGYLPLLGHLDLSRNKLSGHIPSELGQLILDSLNLSSNDLSGKVPSIFDNVAYQKSFLNNPNLCSDDQVLDLHRCASSKHMYLAMVLAIGATIFIVIFCVTFLIKAKVCWQHQKKMGEQQTWEMTAFHKLDFTESKVVSGLIDSNVIGSGGSGKVYCIAINDSGKKVAVKKIQNDRKSKHSLEKQFLAEVEILGRIRHANIVKLWCCISSEESKLLVYEYLENESLDQWLHAGHMTHESSISMRCTLDWPTRLRIAIGAAKGLCYLHHDCSPAIIHRDVKSSNILLDLEFNAKVADFGLSKISINRTGEPYTASAIAGSFGYIAPEYTRTRRLNEKIDIYSFGVVLLELSTGKEPRRINDHLNLADWSQQYYLEGYLIEDALDSHIKEPQYLQEMMNVFKLGVMCTRVIPSSRPSMKQVLELLISFNHREASDDTTSTENGEERDVITSVSMGSHVLA